MQRLNVCWPLRTPGEDWQNLAMHPDPNFRVVQDFSVAVPDALFDVVLCRDDVDGGSVVNRVGVGVFGRRRERELFDPVDLDEGQVERALVHVAGPVEVPEVVEPRRLPHKDQVELKNTFN